MISQVLKCLNLDSRKWRFSFFYFKLNLRYSFGLDHHFFKTNYFWTWCFQLSFRIVSYLPPWESHLQEYQQHHLESGRTRSCPQLLSCVLLFVTLWTLQAPLSMESSVQLFSCVWLFATPWTAACQASLCITNSQSLPKLMSIESVMPSSLLILCHPLLLLPSIFPSIRVFSNESALCIRWPKYWSFSFNINPSNEHPGLISFRMDWFHLLAVQGTLKSLLQHHSSKASVLQPSAFFIVQLSHPCMTIGKTIALTRQTFVGKTTSLLSNMLSKLVITFLPRGKHLLISWLK